MRTRIREAVDRVGPVCRYASRSPLSFVLGTTADLVRSEQKISGTAGVVMSNPSDPSDFEKDPR